MQLQGQITNYYVVLFLGRTLRYGKYLHYGTLVLSITIPAKKQLLLGIKRHFKLDS